MLRSLTLALLNVARTLIFGKQAKASCLLEALNQCAFERCEPIRLIENIADTIQWALNPTKCVIWMRGVPSVWNKQAAWLGAKPPRFLIEDKYEYCTQPGTHPTSALKDRPLRTAFIEAGISLVTPVVSRREVIGWLGIGPSRRGQIYTAETRCFLEILAHELAMAIQVICLKAELESSVMELRRAYQQVMRAQERERSHLAGILHDETLQQLADLSVRLGLLRGQHIVESSDWDDLQRRLARTDRCLREIVRGIYPAILSDLGLIEAVIALLETLSLSQGELPACVELRVIGFDEERLPDPELELALYRFTQNAVLNAIAHGKPNHVEMTFNWGPDVVEVQIKDDGCGMNTTIEEAARAGHFGLLTMRERIKAFGGRFNLSSTPGQGTQLSGCVPLTTGSPATGKVQSYTFELF